MKKILVLAFLMTVMRIGYSEEGFIDKSYHVVEKGDTLTSVAAEYEVDIEDIRSINDLNGDKLKVGEKLYLDFGEYKERWISVEVQKPREITSGTRRIKGRGILSVEDGSDNKDPDFIWPIEWQGATSKWGYRTDPVTGEREVKHSGIDLKAKMGTPVYAPANGVVRVAEWWNGYGRVVIIDHISGYSTRFAHLSKYTVKAGDTVRKGDLIAKTGSSGKSTGPHLHYEIRRDEVALNPMKFKEEEILVKTSEEVKDEVAFSPAEEEQKN